jgi:tetratricopeptide (TPR) repeat protein
VQSRLAGLDSEARRVLRAASVFGEVCWPGGVTALLGGVKRSTNVRERLTELVESEVLVRRTESRFPGEEELAFRHALLREGAYAMLTEEDRILGHRLAGEWLVKHGASDPMVLAEHFERGKEAARAGSFYLRAVEQAHQAGDTGTAIARARQALASGVPEQLRIALLGMLCVAYVYRPEALRAAEPEIEEVMRLSAPGSAPWAQAASAKLVGALHMGKPEEFMATLRVVKEVEPSADAAFSVGMTLMNGIYISDAWGQLEGAEAVLKRMHALFDSIAFQEPLAPALLNIIHAIRDAYANEDPWTGLMRAKAAQASFREFNHYRGVTNGQVYAGMNLWFLGAFEEAERELMGIERTDDEIGGVHRSLSLIFVLLERDTVEKAARIATRLVESAVTRSHRMDEGRGRWTLAEVLRRQGNLEAAEREARASLDLLKPVPLDHIAATATLAAILLAEGHANDALNTAKDALERYLSVGACGFFRGAFLRLVHAEALHATGDKEAARAAIAEARDRLLGNAAKIGEPAYKKSFLENVPENRHTLELARDWLGS